MSVANPIPQQTRQSVPLTASAGQTLFGPFDFVLYDANDVEVWVKVAGTDRWSEFAAASFAVTPAAPATALPALFTVTLAIPRGAGDQICVFGARFGSRITDVTRGGVLQSRSLEAELDRVVATMQELRRDINRAALLQPGALRQFMPPVAPDQVLGWNRLGNLDNVEITAGDSLLKATEADALTGLDDVRYMTPLKSALGRVKQSFPTRADFRASNVSPAVETVEVLGTNAPGDNGKCNFIRIGPSTQALWREQSADGQWWAINDRILTPEMLFMFSGVDCTAGFAALSDLLNNFTGGGGYVVYFTANAVYDVWPAGTTPTTLCVLTNLKAVTFHFNGARIRTNNPWAGPNGAAVFYINKCSGLNFFDPWYQATAAGPAIDPLRYGLFFYVEESSAPWTNNVLIVNGKMDWGSSFLSVSGDTTGAVSDQAHNFVILNAELNHVFYGLSFQGSGDDVFARGIKATDCGRIYFPWNVRKHDIEVSKNGGGNAYVSVILKAFGLPAATDIKRSLCDITVRFTDNSGGAVTSVATAIDMQQNVPQVNITGAADNGAGLLRLTVDGAANMATGQKWFVNSAGGITGVNGKVWPITRVDNTHLDLQGSAGLWGGAWTAGGYLRVPATLRDITIEVENTLGTNQPPSFNTYKENADGTPDLTTSGYTVENLTLSGSLKGYDYGTSAINMFVNNGNANGTWIGETIRNVTLRNLTIGGSNSAVNIDATAVESMLLENVSSPATVPWTVTDPNLKVKRLHAHVTGVSDATTVVPEAGAADNFLTSIGPNGAVGKAPLTTVNANVGSFGDGTHVGQFTVDAKGRIIAAASVTITGAAPTGAAGGALGGTYPNPSLGSFTSANLAAALTDETGSGKAVFDTNPNFSAGIAVVGNAAAGTFNNVAIATLGATAGVLLASGKTLGVNNSITLNGTDLTAMTLPTTNATIARTDAGQTFNGTQVFSSTIIGSISGNAATATAVALGGISGLGTGVPTALAINVGSAGAPVTFNGALGTPSSGSASNLTGSTAAVDTSNTNLATNAFVLNQAASATPANDGYAGVVGTSTRTARADHSHAIALTTANNALNADVLLNNTATFFDGPSMAQGTSGTWDVKANILLTDAGAGGFFQCKLWDGTSVIAATNVPVSAGSSAGVSLSGILANPAGNIRISVKPGSTTTGKILFNNTGTSKDATIYGSRIA
jgi:hypothetical protein